MPVFTLKNYEESLDSKAAADDLQTSEQEQEQEKKEQFVTIQANDSVAKIVANALYKAIPNVAESDRTDSVDTQVVSTEDINRSPVDTWNLVKNTDNVVIINKGFSTAKEEWFLNSLEKSNSKVFYSIESYLKSLEKKTV